jgi:hypothetical protein
MTSISKQDSHGSAFKVTIPRPFSGNTATATTNALAPIARAAPAQSAVIRDYNKDTFTRAKVTEGLEPRTARALMAPLQSQTADLAPQNLMDSGRAADATSGAEAAARLKNEDNYFTAEWQSIRAQDFMKTVEAHKDDPAFMQQMYKDLGPELTSQLLGDAANAISNDNQNTYPTEADAQSALSDVAQSLNSMPASFQSEVGQMAGKNNPQAAMILKNGASEEAKLGFLEGVKSSALGSDYDSSFAARMAGEVIASDPKLVQHVADTWSASDISTLLKNGLQTPPLSDGFHSQWPSFRPDGLERMVGMTADLEGDPYADLRTRVFRDASLALGKSSAGDENRQSLVDNLKTLFKSDAEGITGRLFNNTGDLGSDNPYDSSQQALGFFFRDALFAQPGQDPAFNEFVSNFMGDLRGRMFDPNTSVNENNLAAKQLGDVLGSLVAGYSRAVKDNGEQQAARKALASTLVGLVAKPIEVGGGPVGSMAKAEAEKLVSRLLGDFLNGGLKADAKGMTELMRSLLGAASAGTRDFDAQHGTSLETNVKNEAMWINFIRELFN